MNEQEAREKTLHEVWDHFQAQITSRNEDIAVSVRNPRLANRRMRNATIAQKVIDMLRTILLERCRETLITIEPYQDGWLVGSKNVFCSNNVESIKDWAAAWAFMAWELEQRQKEAKP